MAPIRFASDPKEYDLDVTIRGIIWGYMLGVLTEERMVLLLRDFKVMKREGTSHVAFLIEFDSDMLIETSVWFRQYGLGPDEEP